MRPHEYDAAQETCQVLTKKYEETHEPWTLEDVSKAFKAIEELTYARKRDDESFDREDMLRVLENMSRIASYLFTGFIDNRVSNPLLYLTEKLYPLLKRLAAKENYPAGSKSSGT
ncbi:MAG: hypothetical protein K6T65_07040 [Peptococcaceae bacterium]|nr:hypothetical protein [Peptococcaceae bacterium]